MKKLICLLLALSCLFSLLACKKNKNDDTDGNKEASVASISEIINKSSPTKIVTESMFINGSDTLVSNYTTEVDKATGNSKFTFKYQRYAEIEEMLPTSIKTVSGVIYRDAEGKISYNEGDTWTAGDATAYLPFELNISEARFVKFELKDNGNDLYAEISVEEAKRVFGTDIAADGNIILEINTNGSYLYNTKITYTVKNSDGTKSNVIINSSYDYAQINISFGSAG